MNEKNGEVMHISTEREIHAVGTANKSILRLGMLSILTSQQGGVLPVGCKLEDMCVVDGRNHICVKTWMPLTSLGVLFYV